MLARNCIAWSNGLCSGDWSRRGDTPLELLIPGAEVDWHALVGSNR